MRAKTIDLITLGCSKNLVDSERVIKMFEKIEYTVTHNPSVISSDIVIINTCGFIGDAKEESINTILECVAQKKDGIVSKVYVMGCLSERYRQELPLEIPEVDKWYGKFDWNEIVSDFVSCPPILNTYERSVTTPPHYAYIKIAEGCNRFCAFCAIPLITGRYKSRTIGDILTEVELLAAKGVREFNVIAQDLSYYGRDIYGRCELPELIDHMARITGVEWIRLHYAYPNQFPIELLDVMNKHANVCKYLDIALQHSSDIVLSNMRRNITKRETERLLSLIRERVPGIHIRTTLMVGFPGEDEGQFRELLDFVKEQKFERMGAFAYCEEDDTYAAQNYPDKIPSWLKKHRLNVLMDLQEQISYDINASKIGKVMRVIIDSEERDHYVGRTEFDSPEVDPEVLISKNKPLKIGEFYDVEIINAMPFELIGNVI